MPFTSSNNTPLRRSNRRSTMDSTKKYTERSEHKRRKKSDRKKRHSINISSCGLREQNGVREADSSKTPTRAKHARISSAGLPSLLSVEGEKENYTMVPRTLFGELQNCQDNDDESISSVKSDKRDDGTLDRMRSNMGTQTRTPTRRRGLNSSKMLLSGLNIEDSSLSRTSNLFSSDDVKSDISVDDKDISVGPPLKDETPLDAEATNTRFQLTSYANKDELKALLKENQDVLSTEDQDASLVLVELKDESLSSHEHLDHFHDGLPSSSGKNHGAQTLATGAEEDATEALIKTEQPVLGTEDQDTSLALKKLKDEDEQLNDFQADEDRSSDLANLLRPERQNIAKDDNQSAIMGNTEARASTISRLEIERDEANARSSLQSDRDELLPRVAKNEDELTRLEIVHSTAMFLSEELTKQVVSKKDAQIDKVANELESATTKVSELQLLIKSLTKERDAAKESVSELMLTQESIGQVLSYSMDSIKVDCDRVETEKEYLREQVGDLSAKVTSLETEREELKAECNQLTDETVHLADGVAVHKEAVEENPASSEQVQVEMSDDWVYVAGELDLDRNQLLDELSGDHAVSEELPLEANQFEEELRQFKHRLDSLEKKFLGMAAEVNTGEQKKALLKRILASIWKPLGA